ncbi:putative DNA-binding protein [Paenibacillus thermotolerans]|uniref:putative DNA-binding protein n=1 Tax=Paenibacillus thermotolerans TaxID=3027807 RepID=UPI002367B96D|nr:MULTISPECIES: putative DNA-binding protein [unclassified Paenibacillus]
MPERTEPVERDALSKTNRINLLFDFYESLLTDKQRTFLKYHFHDDFSLGEIAEEFNVSRQAIYEHIKRAETTLEDYERKLRLYEKHEKRTRLAEQIRSELEGAADPRQRENILALLAEML